MTLYVKINVYRFAVLVTMALILCQLKVFEMRHMDLHVTIKINPIFITMLFLSFMIKLDLDTFNGKLIYFPSTHALCFSKFLKYLLKQITINHMYIHKKNTMESLCILNAKNRLQ